MSALSAGGSDAAPASGVPASEAAASALSEEAALSLFPKVCCSQSEKPLPTQALPAGAQFCAAPALSERLRAVDENERPFGTALIVIVTVLAAFVK